MRLGNGRAVDAGAAGDRAQRLFFEQLREETDRFRKRVEDGESLDSLLPEAFATVREAGCDCQTGPIGEAVEQGHRRIQPLRLDEATPAIINRHKAMIAAKAIDIE